MIGFRTDLWQLKVAVISALLVPPSLAVAQQGPIDLHPDDAFLCYKGKGFNTSPLGSNSYLVTIFDSLFLGQIRAYFTKHVRYKFIQPWKVPCHGSSLPVFSYPI